MDLYSWQHEEKGGVRSMRERTSPFLVLAASRVYRIGVVLQFSGFFSEKLTAIQRKRLH